VDWYKRWLFILLIFIQNSGLLSIQCPVLLIREYAQFLNRLYDITCFVINVVKGVLFVVHVTLVPVSHLSAPSAVHSYRVPGKFIRRPKSLFVGWKVYSSITNKAKIYSPLRNRPEKLTEGSLFCLFLKLVQINFIFTDNVRILYIYFQINNKSTSFILVCTLRCT
jgi:hypothetical protein